MDKDVGAPGMDLRPGATGTAAGLAGCEQAELRKERAAETAYREEWIRLLLQCELTA